MVVLAVSGSVELSVAVTVAVNVPVWLGSPDRAPEEGSSTSPVGKAPPDTPQVIGLTPPEEVSEVLYGCPCVASGNVDVGSASDGVGLTAIVVEREAVSAVGLVLSVAEIVTG
jgi:hypothetical protein